MLNVANAVGNIKREYSSMVSTLNFQLVFPKPIETTPFGSSGGSFVFDAHFCPSKMTTTGFPFFV